MRKEGGWRILLFALCVVVLGGVIALRLFFIQVRNYELYSIQAQGQHATDEELLPNRGEIYFRDPAGRSENGSDGLWSVAVNKRGNFAYAVPKEVPKDRVGEISAALAQALALDPAVVLSRIAKRSDPYEPLKRRLSESEAGSVSALEFPGIYLGKETWRYYPAKELSAPLVGFTEETGGGRGLYGVEKYYEKQLVGEAGYRVGEKDALGSLIPFRTKEERSPKDGDSLVLTIDANIQFAAQKVLRETLKQWESPGGTMLVMEPITGRMLAMVSEPSYDPNAYGDVKDLSVFMNPAIEKVFEPGSVFKPITMASALNEKLVTPKSTYVDEGIVRIGGYAIRNFDDKAYGVRTMSEVIELSLNTGAVYAQKLLGNARFAGYVKAFGFGERLGMDLPGELKGSTANLRQKAEINYATASFGQGISVTALQMTAAIGAIANGGALMRPYVVDRVVHQDGTGEDVKPAEVRRVLSQEAARDMTRMMVDAVRGKFEKRAGVAGYYVAGKTGTAQIPDPRTGGYLPVNEGVIHTFVGYAPAFAPKFLVFIKMDKPVGVRFAASSLTPAFHDMAVYLINYYSIPPDLPEELQETKKK